MNKERTMQKVNGIGGFFFRAKDPTAFAPFAETTTYFGRPEQAWMINFRVSDLDAMVAQLRAAAIEVEVNPEVYPNGRFARLKDSMTSIDA